VRLLTGMTCCLSLWAMYGITCAQDLTSTPSPPEYKGQKFEILGDTGPASSTISITSDRLQGADDRADVSRAVLWRHRQRWSE
jgi:hypothetical protein